MPIVVKGIWSSIKPKNDGKRPPMTRDGIIDIQTYEDVSGVITGFYTDLIDGYTRAIQGFFRSAGGFLTIQHALAEGYYLLYEGRIVASKEDAAFSTYIVAGTWKKRNALVADPAADPAATVAAQEDGIWVVTKP